MSVDEFLPYLLVMAGVTYLIRMVPLLFKKKIGNRRVRSFLFYVPYAVLGAMTFPDVFASTGNLITATVGVGVALLLSWREKPLLVAALSACGTVLVAQFLLSALGM